MTPQQFKQARKKLNLTQAELASELGLAKHGKTTIRRIEAGANASGLLLRCFELLILTNANKND
jgi:DNA-binding XRE family transcriptional regulator